MNRYLTIPMVVCLVGFGAVYFALASSPKSSEPIEYDGASNSAVYATEPAITSAPVRLTTIDQASTLILDGWPTQDRHAAMSRVFTFQPLYAKLGPLAQNGSHERFNFLSSLEVVTPIQQHRFPVNVDRRTNEIHIFADGAWRPYQGWRVVYQPLLEKNELAVRLHRLQGSVK